MNHPAPETAFSWRLRFPAETSRRAGCRRYRRVLGPTWRKWRRRVDETDR